MSSRKVPFVNGEYYHIFNRGVAKMPIYNNAFDNQRFMKTMSYYQKDGSKPKLSHYVKAKNAYKDSILDTNIVEFVSYCLMPNHFHMLLQQTKDSGITEFVSKLSNSYTRYFNVKHKRIGPLFQGEFKSVHVETTEQLLHLSRYIHLNPVVGYVVKKIEDHQWSSYSEFIGKNQDAYCSKEIILNQFSSPLAYEQFVLDHEKYAKELDFVKHQLIDYD